MVDFVEKRKKCFNKGSVNSSCSSKLYPSEYVQNKERCFIRIFATQLEITSGQSFSCPHYLLSYILYPKGYKFFDSRLLLSL